MAREGRKISSSGVYQILLRGVDKLFLKDDDYSEFRKRLAKHFGENPKMRLLAYLLLPNRVQLVIDASGENPSLVIKPLCTGYARYFNRTYSAGGRLFYDRFKSVPCENADEISDTVAFLHSVGSSFAKKENFSLDEYQNGAKLCDVSRFFELCTKSAEYTKAHTLHLDDYDRLDEAELTEYLRITCGKSADELCAKSRDDKDFIMLFSGRGASMRKLLPLLGIKPISAKQSTAKKPAAKSAPKPETKKSEPKPEPQPESKKPETKNRNLSVWLL